MPKKTDEFNSGLLEQQLTELEKNLEEIEGMLAKDGPSITLSLERNSLSLDVLNAAVNTYNTDYEERGRALNQRGGQISKEILTGIDAQELKEKLECGAQEIEAYAAGLLVKKFDEQLGVSNSWIKQHADYYFDWYERYLTHSENTGPDEKTALALKYIDNEKYGRAIELLQDALKEGAITAAEELGDLYCRGDVPEDGDLARNYYETAIKKFSSPRAMVSLAQLYLSGDLIEEDDRQAYLLARKAAKQQIAGRGSNYQNEDIAEGAYLLASCYDFGFGTRANKPKAHQIYRDLGPDYSEENHINIAKGHLDGIGVKQDTKKAISILIDLANSGNEDAARNLGYIYSAAEYGIQDKTNGFKFRLMAASRDDPAPLSCYQVGCNCLYGDGVPEDETEALRWFQKAYSQVKDHGRYLSPDAFEHIEDLLFSDNDD